MSTKSAAVLRAGIVLSLTASTTCMGAPAQSSEVFRLRNETLVCAVTLAEGRLQADTVRLCPKGKAGQSPVPNRLVTDGDFLLEIVWTGWKAPGFVNNAENPLRLTKEHFRFLRAESLCSASGAQELRLYFQGEEVPFQLLISYSLGPADFFVRRVVCVRDSTGSRHFLSAAHPRRGWISPVREVVKSGGFGQPIAGLSSDGGFFAGMEYPIATNRLEARGGGSAYFDCSVEVGEVVGSLWLQLEPVVVGLTPDPHVRLWFFRYLDAVRVAPLRPYLLYNSWYDLRAPEMVHDSGRVLNERNLLRTIARLRAELVEKRGVRLDAVVLDDGWDVYRSDWRLREREFPRGLDPLRRALADFGACLGLWVGPIGGYSHRDWRIRYMGAVGYETVGDQMCVAGQRYSRRLKELVTGFVRNDSVLYFKWDGIQFSCSEPNHGHLPGIYSRRATMGAVIDLCRSVRAVNPAVFTNVTSGTWLSPWWLRYTNTIWMQGEDYGYANIPSYSRRDRAMTYRDYVLYDDLVRHDFWFPVANLMTHGIIKGQLQLLGSERESLEEFTNDALLYVARGPLMWELYISPDVLSDGEWDALSAAIHWAKDRWTLLARTFMVGGDPGLRQPYAYVHFCGRRGVVAARNPVIEAQELAIPLSAELGLQAGADSLVIVQTYPTTCGRGIHREGDTLKVSLSGYELAVYEIFPSDSLPWPVWNGMHYRVSEVSPGKITLTLLGAEPGKAVRLVNPDGIIAARDISDQAVDPVSLRVPAPEDPAVASPLRATGAGRQCTLSADVSIAVNTREAVAAFLLEPEAPYEDKPGPAVVLRVDGKRVQAEVEEEKGHWIWLKVPVAPGRHRIELALEMADTVRSWQGRAGLWLITYSRPEGARTIRVSLRRQAEPLSLPPSPWTGDLWKRTIQVGKAVVRLQRKI